MDVGELGPGDRDHLGSGVELHGARTQANHGRVEGQVFVLEALQVAKHLSLCTAIRLSAVKWLPPWGGTGE